MRFGAWIPIENAAGLAPEGPGVLQARADGLLAYPRGKSAMVYYAACATDDGLRAFAHGPGAEELRRASAAGARWIRFAETTHPAVDLQRLLAHFVERFGAPPMANVATAAGEAS